MQTPAEPDPVVQKIRSKPLKSLSGAWPENNQRGCVDCNAPVLHSPSTRCLNSRFPSGQSPNPDSPLICPAGPISTNRLPHERANSRARAIVKYGSVLLATTIVGNG